MCSITPPRQSRTTSTSRPRFAGNGLRLVVIDETYGKCKLLSYIGHDATISCQGQILQAPFQDLLCFSRKKLNTSCVDVFQESITLPVLQGLDPPLPRARYDQEIAFELL